MKRYSKGAASDSGSRLTTHISTTVSPSITAMAKDSSGTCTSTNRAGSAYRQACQHGIAEHLFGCAHADQSTIDEHHVIRMAPGAGQIMGHHDDGAPLATLALQCCQYQRLAGGIDPRQGFVEQQNAGLLGQGPGQHDTFFLPARQVRNRTGGTVGHVNGLERGLHRSSMAG